MDNDMGIRFDSSAQRKVVFQSGRRFDIDIAPLLVESAGDADVNHPNSSDIQAFQIRVSHAVGTKLAPDVECEAFELRYIVCRLGNVQRLVRIYRDLGSGHREWEQKSYCNQPRSVFPFHILRLIMSRGFAILK